jgi:dienelactone hydrolase
MRVGAVLLVLAGCSPLPLHEPTPVTAELSGTVRFGSAGSLAAAGGGRYAAGDPVTITGVLRFPAGAGPFPAVILAHGCSGVGAAVRGWAETLRAWGYATLAIDSFTPRGLREVCTQGRALRPTQRIPDAYGALRALAAHPRIDPKRVALMGFSHGGALAMGAATQWAQETYAPQGQPAFRAFLAFYPNCNADYPERMRVSAPVRIHAGEIDDWTPSAPCVKLAKMLRDAGQDVEIAVYPGAHHAFDAVGLRTRIRLEVGNGAQCFARMASILGPVLNAAELRDCGRNGATIGWNREATAKARELVRAQLAELLR